MVIDRAKPEKDRWVLGPIRWNRSGPLKTSRAVLDPDERTGQMIGAGMTWNERTGQTNGTVMAQKQKPPILSPQVLDLQIKRLQ